MENQKDLIKKKKLEGKVAIVTGATSGIGLEVALTFFENGAKVIFSSNQPKEGEKIINELLKNKKEKEQNIYFFECDVTNSLQVEELINFTIEKYGRLDIMANIAGIAIPGGALDITNEDWDKTLKVNCTGTMYGIRAAAKIMKEKEIQGSIINTSSILGSVGITGGIAYCASKGAIEQITKAAALDLAPFNIRVNAIAPGYIYTPMSQALFEDKNYLNFVINETPLKRVGLPKEIAPAFLFLACNEDSSYITGSILPINGGWTCH